MGNNIFNHTLSNKASKNIVTNSHRKCKINNVKLPKN